MALTRKTKTDDQRFLENVGPQLPCGCRLWLGATDIDGYGKFSYYDATGTRKMALAHRYAFFREHGYWPPQVRHDCDTPACVEGPHLLAGDHTLNMQDRQSRGRQARGSRHGSAKLSDATVEEIRGHLASGLFLQKELAEIYGVSPNAISRIKRGQAYVIT